MANYYFHEITEPETIVLESVESDNDEVFRCKAVDDAFIDFTADEPCGDNCPVYDPINGISGCCKYFRSLYITNKP